MRSDTSDSGCHGLFALLVWLLLVVVVVGGGGG